MKRRRIKPSTTRHEPMACRTCGEMFDAHTNFQDDAKPYAGAASVCAYCGEISIIEDAEDGGFTFREPNAEELIKLYEQQSQILRALNQVRIEMTESGAWPPRRDQGM